MTTDWQNSVVRIVSKDEKNSRFGTGFIIYHDEISTYVLTCAHVVKDVGGTENVKLLGMIPDKVISGQALGIDLAILQLKKCLEKQSIKLAAAAGDNGRSFVTAGFQLLGKDHLIRELEGNLGKHGGIETTQNDYRIPIWDLQIKDDYTLQPGYSGSPVIDTEIGCAIGVVSHRQGQGDKGIAISVRALENIWDSMPPNLLKSQESPKKHLMKLSDSQRKRLKDKLDELQMEYDLVSENIKVLAEAYQIEAGNPKVKLQRKRELDKEKAERDNLERQMDQITKDLEN